jgi:hypothetical protein
VGVFELPGVFVVMQLFLLLGCGGRVGVGFSGAGVRGLLLAFALDGSVLLF